MNKTLTSIIAIALSLPAMAAVDISVDNYPDSGDFVGPALCDTDTLKSATGPVSLEADWSANVIHIEWDGNSGSTPTNGAASCTYDGTFTLPTKPTRTGYTFAGWTVQQHCFAGLGSRIGDFNDYSNYSYNSGFGEDGNTTKFGLTQENTWAVELIETVINEEDISRNHGVVRGIAKCSSTYGQEWETGNPNTDTNGQYCWCQATSYTPNGGMQCNSLSPWVVPHDYDGTGDCSNCAFNCEESFKMDEDFRNAVAGMYE